MFEIFHDFLAFTQTRRQEYLLNQHSIESSHLTVSSKINRKRSKFDLHQLSNSSAESSISKNSGNPRAYYDLQDHLSNIVTRNASALIKSNNKTKRTTKTNTTIRINIRIATKQQSETFSFTMNNVALRIKTAINDINGNMVLNDATSDMVVPQLLSESCFCTGSTQPTNNYECSVFNKPSDYSSVTDGVEFGFGLSNPTLTKYVTNMVVCTTVAQSTTSSIANTCATGINNLIFAKVKKLKKVRLVNEFVLCGDGCGKISSEIKRIGIAYALIKFKLLVESWIIAVIIIIKHTGINHLISTSFDSEVLAVTIDCKTFKWSIKLFERTIFAKDILDNITSDADKCIQNKTDEICDERYQTNSMIRQRKNIVYVKNEKRIDGIQVETKKQKYDDNPMNMDVPTIALADDNIIKTRSTNGDMNVDGSHKIDELGTNKPSEMIVERKKTVRK